MVSWNDVNTLFTPSITNATVTVKTQKEIEASYSKDNNLKSLSIEGYEITPAFSKDVTEYSVEVPDDVLSIKVSARVSDGTASLRGTGTIDVSEGSNKVDVVVTAQNGATKTYSITVAVKDLHPIEVDVSGEKMSVVKKESLLTCPTGYTPKTIKIDDMDVPAFISEITTFVLVGLKDESGNIKLYKYDESGYEEYSELKSKGLILYPETPGSLLEGFKKGTITINDIEVTSYTNPSIGNNVLVYAINVENGYKGYYIYDKDESSFIRYDDSSTKAIKKQENEYKLIIGAVSFIALILLLIAIIIGCKLSKLKKMISKKIPDKKEKQKEQ